MPSSQSESSGVTVVELIAAFRRKQYYVKDGKPTSEVGAIEHAIRFVRRFYGRTIAAEFTPKKLKAVRHAMVNAGLCRTTINQHVGRLRRMFRWAVEEELVPGSVLHELNAVTGLKRGRTEAREPVRIQPVPDDIVQKTLAKLPAMVADMVRLQRLTAMRPAEICAMRV